MTILKILPSEKKGATQYYEVSYEKNFKKLKSIHKEKDVIRVFGIDKKEFKMILRNSLMGKNF